MNTVLITGASGFIARHLAATLKPAGLRVVGVSRSAARVPGFDAIYCAALGSSLKPALDAETVDGVVHCANAAGDDELDTNVRGTTRWLEEARAGGANLQIFLSSLSARKDAFSSYGRAKYQLEQTFIQAGEVAFRLGLVIGQGGMFGRMMESLRRLKVVPLIDNGAARTYVLGIDFLCWAIRDSFLQDGVLRDGERLRGRVWHLQQPAPYLLRDVMASIRRHSGGACRFVPVPSLPVLWLLQAAERMPVLRLPVSSTNLKGLRQAAQETFPSDFARFGYPAESLDELVKRAQS